MIYDILRFLMSIVLRVYLKRVYLSGIENVSQNKPTILACNHPSTFFDAILVGCLVKQPIHFLARSDVFNTSFKRWILWKMKVIPVYRLQEGAENLIKNEQTFSKCNDILKKNGTVLIFSEGLCVQEKRVRKLKKGTARIAFGALAQGIKNLEIIPVGINYTYPEKFREEAILSFGKPIQVSDFEGDYKELPSKAIIKFNEVLEKKLQEEIIIIPEKEMEEISEKLLVIERNNVHEKYKSWLYKTRKRLELEQSVCNHVSKLVANEAEYTAYTKHVNNYFELLEKNKINDRVVAQSNITIFNTILIIIFFPVFLAGTILNAIPLFFGKIITKKVVKKKEFIGAVNMMCGFMLYMIIFLVVMTVLIFFKGITYLPFALFIIPISYISVFYYDILYDYFARLKFSCSNKVIIKNIIKARKEIYSQKEN
jgi:1-acyl-sn-glycerol-3-phosphate acyltransferase